MSGLLKWLDEKPATKPAAVPTTNPAPTAPLWPNGVSTAKVLSLVGGLERELFAAIVETGDQADQALQLVQTWHAAIVHNAKHGSNWLNKHRAELVALLKVALPGLLPVPADEKELEGNDLARCVMRVFPGSYKGLPPEYMAKFFGLGVLGER